MPKSAYHQGNLREDVLDAALARVRAGGMAALVAREVAREVGVTPAAVAAFVVTGVDWDAPLALDELQRDWHRTFYPLEYATGIMRFRMPPVVGTVKQVKHRSLPYQLMVRTAIAAGG